MANTHPLFGAGQVPGLQQVHIPSEQEKAEVAMVRAMQVRTAAADQATKLLAGKAPAADRWLKVALVIERYILGEPQTDLPSFGVGRPQVN